MSAPQPRPGFELIPRYSRGMPAAGRDGHSLASNEAPDGPSPAVLEAIVRAAATANRYPPPTAELVERLAARLNVEPRMVAVAGGSLVLLQQLVAAFAGPAAEVLFGWRSYEAYPIIAAVAGATPVRVGLVEQRIDLERLAEAVTAQTRIVLLANPNNPTGTIFERSRLDRFLDRVPNSCLVVLDEAYRDFADPAEVPDGVALVREHANVVAMRTFSKAYALAGMRIGYLVAAPEIVAALDRVALPFTLTGIAQAAALASLADAEAVQARVRMIVAERAQVYRALVSEGFSVPQPHANFVWLPLGERSTAFARACAERGISVRPFAGDGVRVTIGSRADNDAFIDAASHWREQRTHTGLAH